MTLTIRNADDKLFQVLTVINSMNRNRYKFTFDGEVLEPVFNKTTLAAFAEGEKNFSSGKKGSKNIEDVFAELESD